MRAATATVRPTPRTRLLTVLKCGGAVADGSLSDVAAAAHEIASGGDVVVVHGAGPQITSEMERRGIPITFVDGRRVTSAEALDVVRDALAAVNVACCGAIGDKAIGLSGDEIGLAAVRVPRLGLVGEPIACSPGAVVRALEQGRIPVVAPLGEGPLNVNADEAAVALAIGLGATHIVFMTDVPGVLVDGSVREAISSDEADALLASATLTGGIVPKLRAAVRAARAGLDVRIGDTAVEA